MSGRSSRRLGGQAPENSGIPPPTRQSEVVRPDLNAMFRRLNDQYFEGRCGRSFAVYWENSMTSTSGATDFYKRTIRLSWTILRKLPPSETEDTLLHEMVHVDQYLSGELSDTESHGPLFQRRLGQIEERVGRIIGIGHAAADVVIRRYNWICAGCGDEVSLTRSLDIRGHGFFEPHGLCPERTKDDSLWIPDFDPADI